MSTVCEGRNSTEPGDDVHDPAVTPSVEAASAPEARGSVTRAPLSSTRSNIEREPNPNWAYAEAPHVEGCDCTECQAWDEHEELLS